MLYRITRWQLKFSIVEKNAPKTAFDLLAIEKGANATDLQTAALSKAASANKLN